MEKRRIKVRFVDFYQGFDMVTNDFINILSRKYDVELSDQPEYLFYSCFGDDHLLYDCIRIFYTGECITPDFNECDYAIGFDRIVFSDRYIRVPLYRMFQYKAEYAELKSPEEFLADELRGKEGFCSFVYSNCFAAEERVEFFHLLSKYKTISSGGRYLNNVGRPVGDKRSFQSKCKFSIAFENTSYPGYSTEKLVEAFVAKTIPIYFGDPDIGKDFNNAAFVNCHQYRSFDEVVERVKEIDNDDMLFLSIINEAPLVESDESDLASFLFHIFDQDHVAAQRRPSSVTAQRRSTIILRHRLFEKYVYQSYRKCKNLISRLESKSYILRAK